MSYRAFVLIGFMSIGETAKSGFRLSGFIFIWLSFYRAFGIGLSSIGISSIGLSSYTRLTSVSPSRDDVGDALSTQKETNYAIHAESPNREQRLAKVLDDLKVYSSMVSVGPITNFRCADDAVLAAYSKQKLQAMLDKLNVKWNNYG